MEARAEKVCWMLLTILVLVLVALGAHAFIHLRGAVESMLNKIPV